MSSVYVWFSTVDIFMYVSMVIMLWLLVSIWSQDPDDKWVSATIMIYGINDLTSSVMAFNEFNNLWLYNLVLFPQFIMVMTILIRKIQNTKIRWLLISVGVILILFHVGNILFLQGLHDFNNFSYIPANTWMAASSFFYLREQMEKIDEAPFDKLLTWFALATLIDIAGSMPILSLLGWTDYIHSSQAARLWEVVQLLYTFWYLFILFGLIWTRTSLRSVLRFR